MRFHRDSEGLPVADADSDQIMLANFLQGDIQEDLTIGQEVLEMADQIAAGTLRRYEFSGNAHQLSLDESQASIQLSDDGDSEVVVIPFDVFRRAINGWLTFIG